MMVNESQELSVTLSPTIVPDRRATPTNPPLVSVIIPTYNRAWCLGKCLRSVAAQTYRNLEIIVSDDASTDDTQIVVESIDDPRIRYLRAEVNRGASAARNRGIRAARGEFIAFQDSDDEWLLDKIEIQIKALLDEGSAYGATFGGKLIYGRDAAGRFGPGLTYYRPNVRRAVRSGVLTRQLMEENLISPQTLLVRRSAVEQVGFFDESLPANNDWDFMLRLSQTTQILYTMRPVVLAYISDDSISRNNRNKARSFLRIIRKHEDLFRSERVLYGKKLYASSRYLYKIGKKHGAYALSIRSLRFDPLRLRNWANAVYIRLSMF